MRAETKAVPLPVRFPCSPFPTVIPRTRWIRSWGSFSSAWELCDNVKDLRAFLREIETIAMDLPSSKAKVQYH